MNILMVHPHDLFSLGEPWTIRIVSIARELAQLGHAVRLCYFPVLADGRAKQGLLEEIDTVPLDRTPSPSVLVANTRKLLALCRQSDVVHFQKCHYYSAVPTVIAAYVAGKPLHYDWDDHEEKIWYESVGAGLYSRCIGWTFRALERVLPMLADSVSCASAQLKSLTQRFGVAPDCVFDSPVGADLERFHPRVSGERVRREYGVSGNVVLYVGQLHGGQYVDLFIRASRLVLEKAPDTTFMIVGEGFRAPQMKNLADELGLARRVLFTGSVPHAEVPFYVAAADVCVASFRDTEVTRSKSPLKIAEYMASGKPIVASAVGEVTHMLAGAGIAVDPGNHRALAEGILELLEDETLRARLGRSARHMAETKYNWRQTASSLVKAYEKIAATP